MAIYHYSQKPVSRARGQSAVAGAAYRSADKLHDQRLGQTFDYTRKRGVEHTEIILPTTTDADLGWARNRSSLWNAAEAAEKRKDARIAREHEVALPAELDKDQQIQLLRAFAREIANRYGVAVDFALHRPHYKGDERNFHAHVYSTTREVTPTGLGRKSAAELSDTDRYKRALLSGREEIRFMRARWEEIANDQLLRAGLDIRIDHRTLEAQGIDLLPGRKLGLSRERQQSAELPQELAAKVAHQRAIAAENGRRIIADPNRALTAISHYQATFTAKDIAKYLNTHSDGAEQFQAAYLKVTTSPELVALGNDDRGRTRFTTKEMLTLEHTMLERTERLAATHSHPVSASHRASALTSSSLSEQQRKALEYVTAQGDLAVLVGIAGAGKSTLLDSARRTWEAAGYSVRGAALAGIAAENLENASGIPARTLASWEWNWNNGKELLSHRDVLVIDEAGLVGTRQLARVLEKAEQAGAKVVLVGDPEQLQAIEAGAAFRGIAAQTGMIELTEVWRQKHAWQKEATQQLAFGRTGEALEAYSCAGHIQGASTRDEARQNLLTAWRQSAQSHPGESQIMLAYTREDVRQLNAGARELRRAAGELGRGELIATERGPREFARGDRLLFLQNERALGVKNGSLGTIEKIRHGMLEVRLDGKDGRRVTVDSKEYPHLEHGYASTIHKAQGATVDRAFVLATPHFDRHSTYVALSRHRDSVQLFYGREDFQPEWSRATPKDNLWSVLSRARTKDLAHDYLEYDDHGALRPVTSVHQAARKRPPGATMSEIDALQQQAAERWRDKQLAGQADSPARTGLEHESDLDLNNSTPRLREIQKRPEIEHPGPEEDLEL